ncbi:MAG: hypothetical protein IJU02_01865 [Lachnospiraceae bacterium]|nr:hypothetical protein [Lachnospiraceae bacterium]MBQ9390914.1 hypothetical protein [Lachnospiraceae bacterium]
MGELILCKRPIAAVPYYIEDVSLNVYSIEELCYYVANNAYLINTEFASVELCNWIGREVGKEEEKVLLTILEEEKPLHVFINALLNLCDYLPGEEIRNVTEIISSFENKSPIECSKIRADRLLDKNKIVDAIYEYENILDKCEQDKKDISKEFMGDIWHNLAVCYSRLFFFKEASVCFEYAYQLNRKKISLEAMLCTYRCMRDEEGFNMQVAKYFVPEDLVVKIKKIVTDTSTSLDVKNFAKRLDNMKTDFYDEKSYQKQLGIIIDKWKSDYNRLCNI